MILNGVSRYSGKRSLYVQHAVIRRRRGGGATCAGGFSLVELLVVIGIIALLISILLPALNSVRDHARTVQCLSNMRQLGAAMTMYADANRGIVIPMDYRDNTVPQGPNGYATSDTWGTILVAGGYIDYPQGASTGTYTVFRCPSGVEEFLGVSNVSNMLPASRTDTNGAAGVQQTSKNLRPGLKVYVWYSLNGTTYGNGTDATIPIQRVPPDLAGVQQIWRKIASLPTTSQLVMLFDGVAGNHMTVNANRVNARHQRQTITNILFFDGHCESLKTDTLPGGVGDANQPSGAATTFSNANLVNYPYPKWRTNQ
jgi:prepilin-type N-terminal cleavage/methylation domain-containing protein/prepilin-type processing-associated H-X9-DG protein